MDAKIANGILLLAVVLTSAAYAWVAYLWYVYLPSTEANGFPPSRLLMSAGAYVLVLAIFAGITLASIFAVKAFGFLTHRLIGGAA